MGEFFATLAVATLGSGLVIGVTAWLIFRDAGLNSINDWIKRRDERLEALRVVLLQNTASRVISFLERIEFVGPAAIVLGLAYVLISMGVLGASARSWYPSAKAALVTLDVEVDPKLATYSPEQIAKAREQRMIGRRDWATTVPRHTERPFPEIRERLALHGEALRSLIRERPDAYAVMIAYLLNGTRYSSGGAWLLVVVVTALSAAVEFLAIAAGIAVFRRIAASQSVWTAACWTATLPVLWVLCSALMMFIYRLVLAGTEAKLILIPLWCLGLCLVLGWSTAAVIGTLSWIRRTRAPAKGAGARQTMHPSAAALILVACSVGLWLLWENHPFMNLLGSAKQAMTFPSPLWLGLIVGLPLILGCLWFVLVAVGAVLAEVGRWLAMAVHGWARHVRTTYVGVWVGVLSLLVGVAAGLIMT